MTRGVLAALALALVSCRSTTPVPEGTLVVVKELQASWIRNFNPFSTGGGARWPTNSGIYEPMLIFSSTTGEVVPWLAEAWSWDEAGTTLSFTIRDGVKWSDGEPFDAGDVKFTFDLLASNPGLDAGSLTKRIEEVVIVDEDVVEVRLHEPYVPGLPFIAQQSIVPEHIWKDISDPVTFTNPDPVGTGPFTEVVRFETQIYEMGRNPHYWQPDAAPGLEILRMPAFPSNEQANLALIHGEIDWTGTFIPAIDRVFVGRDPAHHQYWFPLIGSTVFLYPNTTRPPFDDPAVRKALSMAIDRELVVRVAMHGTTRPADATGLSDRHDAWRNQAVADAGDWVRYDPERAGAALDEAGWRRSPDGVRRNQQGETLTVEIQVVSGWSDWVRAAQIISQQLQAIGVDASVVSPDFGAWMEKLSRAEFSMSLGWSGDGATPYALFDGLMNPATVKPVGESAPTNWHRYGHPRAEELLQVLERNPDESAQRAAVDELQRLFSQDAPAIPLFPSPSWGEANTVRFTGFPTADDPYAPLSPHKAPLPLLVLTRLEAR